VVINAWCGRRLGCGRTWQALERQGRRCIRVFGTDLDAKTCDLIPQTIREVPVFVDNIGEVWALEDERSRHRRARLLVQCPRRPPVTRQASGLRFRFGKNRKTSQLRDRWDRGQVMWGRESDPSGQDSTPGSVPPAASHLDVYARTLFVTFSTGHVVTLVGSVQRVGRFVLKKYYIEYFVFCVSREPTDPKHNELVNPLDSSLRCAHSDSRRDPGAKR
jgi:hypothetical protein